MLTSNNAMGLLIEALFKNLEPPKRVETLVQILRQSIAELSDEAVVELIRRLHDVFGLDPSLSLSREAERRETCITVIQIEVMKNRQEFSDILMAVYPEGSIRKKDVRPHTDPQPDFMGTRRAILKYVAGDWNGRPDAQGAKTFEFLLRILGGGRGKVELLEQERQMVFSVIRERLGDFYGGSLAPMDVLYG